MDKTQNNLEEIKKEFEEKFPKDKVIVRWVGKLYGMNIVTEGTEEVEVINRQDTWEWFEQKLNSQIKQSNEKCLKDYNRFLIENMSIVLGKDKAGKTMEFMLEQYKSKEREE